MSTKKFVALLTGAGEGCDYTIGCNFKFKIVEAEDKAAAFEKFCEEFYWDSDGFSNELLDKVQLFELGEEFTEMFNECLEEEKSAKAQEKARAEEASDLAEFERLKNKLGK